MASKKLNNALNRVDVDEIIAYESGEMEEEELFNFFQRLVNSGMAWSLQGHYGRTAMSLLDEGLIEPAS